jgi:glycosyltransferase involved in cell wall biosynthesis
MAEINQLRILYVGNSGGLENIDRFYLFPPRLINGLIRNGHQVQVFNDKDVARLSNLFRSSRMGVKKTNSLLIENCKVFRPELIILAHCQFIHNETLDTIKTICKDVRIIHLNVDPLSHANNIEKIQNRLNHVDGIFVTTAGPALKKISNKNTFASFIPNPVDASIDTGKAFLNPHCEFDVLFVSNALKEHDHRKILAEEIVPQSPHINFEIIGSGINQKTLFGMNYMNALHNSKMGLVINKTEDFYLYASDRMSQYMANGIMVFAHENPQYTDIFGDNHIVTYSDAKDLADKIRYYHEHDAERIQIAENGYHKIRQIFDSTLVARYMVERTMGELKISYPWPTEKYVGDV